MHSRKSRGCRVLFTGVTATVLKVVIKRCYPGKSARALARPVNGPGLFVVRRRPGHIVPHASALLEVGFFDDMHDLRSHERNCTGVREKEKENSLRNRSKEYRSKPMLIFYSLSIPHCLLYLQFLSR